MSTTEQIYALLVAANPVPDRDSPGVVVETKPHLRVVAPATEATQEDGEPPSTSAHRRRRLVTSLAAVVALALILTATTIVLGGGPGVDRRPFDSAPPTTSTVVPTTTGERTPAAGIARAGLPTEWTLTVSTQLTEAEGAVRLDSSIRLDSGQFIAEGTTTQVAPAAEMVQGAVVECAGTTYDEGFLWSAAPHGTGELNFGDVGSVVIEFDAVLVTSSSLAGRAPGRFSPRVCAEWSGTYVGVSGDLAAASGTFTAVFAVASRATGPVWTFDS